MPRRQRVASLEHVTLKAGINIIIDIVTLGAIR